jgi:hypothetical protein
MVRGSNYVQIGVIADRIKNRAIVISTLDNLVKGSAGQAIQNMNLMFGCQKRQDWSRSRCFRKARCRGGRSDVAILRRQRRGLCQAHVYLAPGATDGVSGAAYAGRVHSRTRLRRGGDTAEMLARGFNVRPTDGSPEMAAVASKHLGRTVETLLFHELDEARRMMPSGPTPVCFMCLGWSLRMFLRAIWRALKPSGYFYASYKEGDGDGRDTLNRYYNYPSPDCCAPPMQMQANGARCRSRAAKSKDSTTGWRRCCSSWCKKATEERLPSPRYCPDIAAVRRVSEIATGCGCPTYSFKIRIR